jgi:tetratricopeptide (TPR) repeat protein
MKALKLNRIREFRLPAECLLIFFFMNFLTCQLNAATAVTQTDSTISASVIKSALSADVLISEGNRYYMNREYEQAATCYRKILDMGYASGELYYNLGNTYYKSENLAMAILFYEKALLLEPNDEDTRQNLNLANARIIDKIDNIPVFFLLRWINWLKNLYSPNQWAIFSLVLFALSLAVFVWVVFSRSYRVKRATFGFGIFFLVLSITGLLIMQSRTRNVLHNRSAIIMVPSVNAKSSPDDQSTNIFILHGGTKVMLVDSVQNWKEIRIADGNKGWVPDEVLGEI